MSMEVQPQLEEGFAGLNLLPIRPGFLFVKTITTSFCINIFFTDLDRFKPFDWIE